MLARYYGSEFARFISIDPAPESIDPSNPQTWNKYSYSRNNPVVFRDPDGKVTQVAVGGVTAEGKTGHIAIIQDGLVYSKYTDYAGSTGDWGASAEAYLSAQDNIRGTQILTLDVTPEQEAIIGASLAKGPGPEADSFLHAVGKDSCVAAVEGPLRDAGVLPGAGPVEVDRGGNLLQASAPTGFTPAGTARFLRQLGAVESEITRGKAPDNPADTITTFRNWKDRQE